VRTPPPVPDAVGAVGLEVLPPVLVPPLAVPPAPLEAVGLEVLPPALVLPLDELVEAVGLVVLPPVLVPPLDELVEAVGLVVLPIVDPMVPVAGGCTVEGGVGTFCSMRLATGFVACPGVRRGMRTVRTGRPSTDGITMTSTLSGPTRCVSFVTFGASPAVGVGSVRCELGERMTAADATLAVLMSALPRIPGTLDGVSS
jgi:hypothetical protein